MKKRIVTLLLALTVASSFITGCGAKNTSTETTEMGQAVTKAPIITPKDKIICKTNTPITIKDIVENVSSLTGTVKVSFKEAESEVFPYEKEVQFGELKCTTTAIVYDKAGEYDNVIIIEDEDENRAEAKIHIEVCDAPVIEANDITTEVGSQIDYMQNVKATDCKGNDITSRVSVSQTVDTSVAGQFEAIYSVKDDNGLDGEKKVNVTVNEKQVASNNNNSNGNSSNGNNDGSQSQSASASSAPSSQPQENSVQQSQPVGRAEVFYDGSTSNGLSAEQKAHIDGLVNTWLSGGYTNVQVEDLITDYLFENGIECRSSDVVKDSRFLIPNGVNYTLAEASRNSLYYYGKKWTDGTLEGGWRVGYFTEISFN